MGSTQLSVTKLAHKGNSVQQDKGNMIMANYSEKYVNALCAFIESNPTLKKSDFQKTWDVQVAQEKTALENRAAIVADVDSLYSTEIEKFRYEKQSLADLMVAHDALGFVIANAKTSAREIALTLAASAHEIDLETVKGICVEQTKPVRAMAERVHTPRVMEHGYFTSQDASTMIGHNVNFTAEFKTAVVQTDKGYCLRSNWKQAGGLKVDSKFYNHAIAIESKFGTIEIA